MFDLLGIDWGEKRCGLAFADSQSKLILPANYPCPTEQIWAILDNETKNKPIRQIVVGMPLNFRGQKTKISLFVEVFLEQLKQRFPKLLITTINERGSTLAFANYYPVDKQQLNHLAAAKILEFYLGIEQS